MTMRVATGDHDGALEFYHSAWSFITVVSIAAAICVAISVSLFPFASWLHLSALSLSEARAVALLLTLYAVVALQASLVLSGFRCDGNYASGMFGVNVVRIVEWTVSTGAVALGRSPVAIAATFLAVRTIGMVVLSIILRRKSPWLKYGGSHATMKCIRQLAKPAVAFMAFPVAYALNREGMLLVVGLALGPVAVATFSTARTLTRLATQPAEAIRSAVWPELSAAYGAKNWRLARRLHSKGCQACLALCALAIAFLAVAGPRLYVVWTHNRVTLDYALYWWLLMGIAAFSFWYTSSAVALSRNRHEGVAVAYLAGTTISICVAWVLMRQFGLSGAAISPLIIDVIMSWYVLRNSLRMLEDSASGFVADLFKVPQFLRVSWLSQSVR
jgi:O-antigen/teichoic acid export membrane protein